MSSPRITRRQLLQSAGMILAGTAARSAFAQDPQQEKEQELEPNPASDREHTDFLEELERRCCRFFLEQASPVTGLVLDRAPANGGPGRRIASMAATGFGLSALCIADSRGWFDSDVVHERVVRTLDFLANKMPHKNGFFYHFVNSDTGTRYAKCEVSSIDTAWLLCGVIHARQYFAEPAIEKLANQIVNRVDWRWMLNGGGTLSHGWNPELGFLPYRWDSYSELLAMYILAIGANDMAIPSGCWNSWHRPTVQDSGITFIDSVAPLFAHQYSQAWLDFRNKHDQYANYFENSRIATLRHRKFCLDMRQRFPWFDDTMWGITSSESRYGYMSWGGPESGSASNAKMDGTLVPCASAGSLAFLPDDCLAVLEAMVKRYGKKVWTRYGFVDAFNPHADWWSPNVLGIDVGITLLMAENLVTAGVWQSMMTAKEIQRGFAAAGFKT